MDVDHVSLWVSDLEATSEFYTQVLELDVLKEFTSGDGTRNLKVVGGTKAGIQFKHDPEHDGEVNPSAIAHLALLVDDVDETVNHVVTETGVDPIEPPETNEGAGIRNAFIEDPSGYTVELVEEF